MSTTLNFALADIIFYWNTLATCHVIDYVFLYCTTLNIYFIILRVNWPMVKLVSGDLTRGLIYEDLRQKTCPYLLQVFLKVWYV
jgi:hypothetical protein